MSLVWQICFLLWGNSTNQCQVLSDINFMQDSEFEMQNKIKKRPISDLWWVVTITKAWLIAHGTLTGTARKLSHPHLRTCNSPGDRAFVLNFVYDLKILFYLFLLFSWYLLTENGFSSFLRKYFTSHVSLPFQCTNTWMGSYLDTRKSHHYCFLQESSWT